MKVKLVKHTPEPEKMVAVSPKASDFNA